MIRGRGPTGMQSGWTWVRAAIEVVGAPAVLVTVAEVEGSAPREPGAKMVVGTGTCVGTIGGGRLELMATERARELLATAAVGVTLERYALGPSLGQCCGGAVELLFEPLPDGVPAWLTAAVEVEARGEAAVLVAEIGAAVGRVVRFEQDLVPGVASLPDGGRHYCEPLGPPGLQVVLFGAGHVGKAVVRVLAELPGRITWIDSRAEQFPQDLPANVVVDRTDTPIAAVARAPAQATFLVMTHDHGLDLDLSAAILHRGDFAWFGLIGSATKRGRFVKRLRARGFAQATIDRMVCPIGLPSLPGKHPGEIAIAVAAQIAGAQGPP